MGWIFQKIIIGDETDEIVTSVWPTSRPAGYSPSGGGEEPEGGWGYWLVWGYNPITLQYEWLSPETFPEYYCSVLALGGGRYEQHYVALTSKGEIFYGN